MRTGFVQFAPVLGDLDSTLGRLEPLLNRAVTADIIVLPELSNSGYNFDSREQAWAAAEELKSSRFVQFIQTFCENHDLHVIAGINERDNGKLFNTSVLVGPKGCIGKYRKMHLFMREKDIFEPGNTGLPVFDLGSCKIGMLICFDWIFPEVWRILALKGADIICHPSNLVIPGLAQRAVPIHAVTNRVFVITANRIGTEGNLTFTGLSTIADPGAIVLAQASASDDEVSIVDIDPLQARDKMITERNHALDDRRPDQYTLLTEL